MFFFLKEPIWHSYRKELGIQRAMDYLAERGMPNRWPETVPDHRHAPAQPKAEDYCEGGCLMYKSPIEVIQGDIRMQYDGAVMKAIQKLDILVDKRELLQALQFDRGQYEKGYQDGYSAAKEHGYWNGIEYDGFADGWPVYHLWECSCCHEEYESEGDPPNFTYCPECGARMDAESPEEVDE